MNYRKLWTSLVIVIVASFAVLIYYGNDLYHKMPPIPSKVVTADGTVLYTGQEIRDGQNVWQSAGGQQMGSVWGHGAYVAPDWSADWLHRESVWLLDHWANQQFGKPYVEVAATDQAALREKLREEIRTNTYHPDTGELVVSKDRGDAIQAVAGHYATLFSNAPELAKLREAYAIPGNVLRDPQRRHKLTGFFFWAAWACATDRPGETISYTHNWPPESLVGNVPTGSSVLWSVVSFVLLLAGVGALAWYYAVLKHQEETPPELPEKDPLLGLQPTPSMQATLKYFWVVAALIVAQVIMGVVTAHYGVEGNGFYGIPLAEWLPYSVTRTWHTQLAVFWIATAWLATGLFIAPAVSGHEPKFQRAGVNFLFVCLLIIVVGSMFGTWYGTRQRMGYAMNFLVWPSRLRIRGSRALLANLPLRGIVGVALPHGPGHVAGHSEAGRASTSAGAVPDCLDRDCLVLRGWADVGPANPLRPGGILALVGGASVGGRFLRGLRHRGHCLSLHAHGLVTHGDGHGGGSVFHNHISFGRNHWHLPSSVLQRDAHGGDGIGSRV